VPVSPGEDGAYAAELMLDNFIGWGYGDLVKNAVVLLHDSATQHGDARAIAAKIENRVRAILPIPFDRILDAGGQIDFDALAPATRPASHTAAATIPHGLADPKENCAMKAPPDRPAPVSSAEFATALAAHQEAHDVLTETSSRRAEAEGAIATLTCADEAL